MTEKTKMSRVRADVEFLTWAQSQNGEINVSKKATITIKVWVNHPLDDNYKPDQRGGEQAIKVAKYTAAQRGVEWLGLIGAVVVSEELEAAYVNQPGRAINDLGISDGALPGDDGPVSTQPPTPPKSGLILV